MNTQQGETLDVFGMFSNLSIIFHYYDRFGKTCSFLITIAGIL